MNRRTIFATAGAITLVIVTGAAAAAANLGLLGSATDTGAVGSLTPASATAEPQTVIVEPAPTGTVTPSPDRAAGGNGAAVEDHDGPTSATDERGERGEREDVEREPYEGYHDDD